MAATKIRRNDPCPCGSGKKYKRCCLAAGLEREPEQWFGYDESTSGENPFERLRHAPLCMVTEVTYPMLAELESSARNTFRVGNWAVTAGGCDKIEILGPFEDCEGAFNAGRETFGVTRYIKAPESSFDVPAV